LEGLGESPFRDLEVSQALEEFLDLIEGKSVVILQDHRLDQDMGSQIPVRDFFRGIRSRDHLLTMGAVVTVLPETGDLRTGGDQILLKVLKDFLGFTQGMAAVRTASECLLNHPVNRLRLCPGEALVSRFLSRGLGVSCALGLSEGLQEFLPGFAFLLPIEFSLKFLDLSFFLEDDFDEFFFGFLGKEELAVCFHNPNNGQEGDFFEGLASGG